MTASIGVAPLGAANHDAIDALAAADAAMYEAKQSDGHAVRRAAPERRRSPDAEP